jgi:hypothetical protein
MRRSRSQFFSSAQPPSLPRTSFVNIHSRLYLALYTEEQTERIAQHELICHFLIVPLLPSPSSMQIEEQNIISSSLEEIYKFDQMCHAVMRQNENTKIVFCTGCDQGHQFKITFLLGCHMIMSHGLSSERVLTQFRSLKEMFDADGEDGSMQSSWRAISWAKEMGWIDFRETFERGLDKMNVIQMDEYLHYSRYCSSSSLCVWRWQPTQSSHTVPPQPTKRQHLHRRATKTLPVQGPARSARQGSHLSSH